MWFSLLKKRNPSHICFYFSSQHLAYKNIGHAIAGSTSQESDSAFKKI